MLSIFKKILDLLKEFRRFCSLLFYFFFGHIFYYTYYDPFTSKKDYLILHRSMFSRSFLKSRFKKWKLYQIDYFRYFFKKYIYTINHKRIAINYLIFVIWSGLSGAALATMIRLELAYPGSHFFKGDSVRYLQVITCHGLTMVFFVAVPLIFGFVANFFIPYHIGSKDVAYPRLNSLGFWLLPAGYILMSKPAFLRSSFYKYFDKPSFYYELIDPLSIKFNITSGNYFGKWKELDLIYNNVLILDINEPLKSKVFKCFCFNNIPSLTSNFYNSFNVDSFWRFVINQFQERRKKIYVAKCSNSILTMSGWTFITPFSAKTKFTGAGAQDVAIVVVILSGLSTTISFTNLLVTRRTLSMPGIRYRRILIPFLSISLFLTMRMLVLITPVLGAAMLMLLMDRHWGTSFFDYAYGGDVILFHHLFWFFGHPEVYVVIIPAFGIANMMIPFNNSRRVASKHHLVWATYIMAYMGFLVWGHHMYLVGLDHRSRSMYSTITVMISLPAIVKIVNWTLTVLNGSFVMDLPIMFINSFFFFFLCGGLTGLWLSHVGLNVYVHDTFYVVAHFHFMFSAATFSAIFGLIYYYFYIIFGICYSKIFGYMHLIYWTLGQWTTFLPLFWVGYNGLPRRYHDYPLMFLGWHGMSSIGHLMTLTSIVFFFIMFFDSFLESKLPTSANLGIPRYNKRVMFFRYKIAYLQSYTKPLNTFVRFQYRSGWHPRTEFEILY